MVPLAAADFIEPAGELSAELFPGKDLNAFVTAWLTEAQGKTGVEAAQREWVYYRAYKTVSNRFMSEAAGEGEGQRNAYRSIAQQQHWDELATRHLRQYQALTAGIAPGLQKIGYTS
jgi:hypothetical protein